MKKIDAIIKSNNGFLANGKVRNIESKSVSFSYIMCFSYYFYESVLGTTGSCQRYWYWGSTVISQNIGTSTFGVGKMWRSSLCIESGKWKSCQAHFVAVVQYAIHVCWPLYLPSGSTKIAIFSASASDGRKNWSARIYIDFCGRCSHHRQRCDCDPCLQNCLSVHLSMLYCYQFMFFWPISVF